MKARGVVVIAMLVVLLLSAMYPVRQYVSKRTHLRNLVAEHSELARRIEDLRAAQARLLTDEEIERIAREELGMVRPGEVAFAIVPGADPKAEAAAPPALGATEAKPARAGPAWYQRWWNHVVRSFSAMR